ncbi:MAG: transporter [Oligoflexia bacterium]|nr:MAG: transporter [Oligoflexia bacterium]
MNLTLFWIASRLLSSSQRKILTLTGWVSLLGLVLGVGSLVVSMAVISGFESTLKKSVADVAGHVNILKFSNEQITWQDLVEKIKKSDDLVEDGVPFISIEGVMAHKGKLSGVMMQGLDPASIQKVLNLSTRLVKGQFQIQGGEEPQALIGKGIAQHFGVNIGDQIRIVVPIASELEVNQFRRRLVKLKVAGILDLGKFEYDQRMIFTNIETVQQVSEIGAQYTGILLKLKDIDQARAFIPRLEKTLGNGYRIRDWKSVNEPLFEAVKIERVVIFFVIFVIILAASFNVASSLYINVVQRFSEIAILKSFGLSSKQLVRMLSLQSLVLGGIGCGLGVGVGVLLCFGFSWLQTEFGIIPGSVYKVDHIDIEIRFLDVFIIIVTTLLICYLASLAPAKKGARMTTVEGLRYE